MKKRLKPDTRKEQIVAAAVELARLHGFHEVRRDNTAEASGVSGPVINHYFGTVDQLRRDVARYAIRERVLPVVAELVASRSKYADKIPEELRAEAITHLWGADSD